MRHWGDATSIPDLPSVGIDRSCKRRLHLPRAHNYVEDLGREHIYAGFIDG